MLAAAILCTGQTRQRKPAHPAPDSNRDAWPLTSIAIEGNEHYTREQILAVAGLHIGQTVSKQTFEAARDRLLATGNFRTAG